MAFSTSVFKSARWSVLGCAIALSAACVMAEIHPANAFGEVLLAPVTSAEYHIQFKDGWSSSGAQLLASSAGFPDVDNANTFRFVCHSGAPKVIGGTILLRGTGHPTTGASGSNNHVLLRFNLLAIPPTVDFRWHRPSDNSTHVFSGSITQNGNSIAATVFFDASSFNQQQHQGSFTVTGTAIPSCAPVSPSSRPLKLQE